MALKIQYKSIDWLAPFERALANSSKGGDLVLDLFGGSGSTLIACERTGRACRTMEIDPKYADVIVRRWQEYTGKTAVHAETGELFGGTAREVALAS
jgi:DNA modification methylase